MIIIGIVTFMTFNLLNNTLNDEMSSIQALVSWINQQQEERLWNTIETLAEKPELAEAVYSDDVKKVMDFAQMSLRQINADSLAAAKTELINVIIIIIISSIGVMSIVAIAAGLIGRRITRSIRKINDYAIQVADGNLNAKLEVTGNNDMAQLADIFKNTVSSLINEIKRTDELVEFIQRM